jgi:hypothetical protein
MVTAVARSEVRDVLPEVSHFQHAEMADVVVEIWGEAWADSSWTNLMDVPKGLTSAGDPVAESLVSHVRGVTLACLGCASALREVHGYEIDNDLLLAAALLHDASKVVELEPFADGVRYSEFGVNVQHGVWTANQLLKRDLPLSLTQIIISHTPMSKVVPKPIEGIVLYYADMLDSDAISLVNGYPLLLKK